MNLTDTHTHLYSEQFTDDRDEMIQRALKAGIKRFFVPAIDSTYTDSMFRLKAAYPGQVFLMAGLHPTHVKENFEKELEHIEALLAQHRFYAIGETGIDLYWDRSTLPWQKKAFKYQIKLAVENQLPIVIHCRDAFDEVFEVLEEEKSDALHGIFHCFTGTKEQALQAINYGMKLGIGGVVTFKNGGLDKFLATVDISHIVLETDAPYLAPVPFRGKRNESSYLVYILEKIAGIYGVSPEEIAEITTANSKAVFGV
ncbi:TatD family hydrolase [Ascidiimonas aurantiaca]|uniref:TatD family hydrolase n=1 Tax=Ascidiimonas aurantiaca TaxID=1685432 RepID=UPI0030EE875F